MQEMDIYLRPTATIDSDNSKIKEKAQELVKEQQGIPNKAKALFYFVRDEIKYNLYVPSDKAEYYRASCILETGEGFCIQKAILLAALARAVKIPARLHLAAIRNHLVPARLKELMGGNVFPTHGYDGLYIEGSWIKVAPTFDLKMCEKNQFLPVEFDGKNDSILPSHNTHGKPHIEYVEDRGYYDDLPLEKIIAWRIEALGADFFERMKRAIELRKHRKQFLKGLNNRSDT